MTPSVSVVIPLYNKGRYISEAIDSVLAQTVRDFELIIVDGGSTDGSLEIVAGYTDPRITCFLQEGKGVSTARNQAVQRANAELIAFLDADDAWYPDFLETILKLRQDYPAAGMYGTGYEVYFEGKLVRNIVHTPELGDRLFLSSSRILKSTCRLDTLSSSHPDLQRRNVFFRMSAAILSCCVWERITNCMEKLHYGIRWHTHQGFVRNII